MSDIKTEQAIAAMAKNIANLGPVSCRMLHQAGINSADEFFEHADTEAIFWILFAVHGMHAVNANLLYSIDAALLETTWKDLPLERKKRWKKLCEDMRNGL